jgi:para-aminobenzoate synthetase/4-amino-4-deoxychorismate lyase
MEIIHELEKGPRGVYCGAIGYSIPGSSVFNVPIRTVVLEGEKGEMGIGSGIVHDSDPRSEWQESLLKGRFLTDQGPEFQLIETLLWQPATGYWLLDEHLQRMADSAAYFLFDFPRQDIGAALQEQAGRFERAMRVRLLLHKGGQFSISTAALLAGLPGQPGDPVESDPLPAVLFSLQQTDPGNVHLYHKTTDRGMYLAEREQALAKGCFEVLFTNLDGEVTEGSISNIFIREQGQLVTPPVSCGLLAGTFRRYLLEREMAVEKILSREDVFAAEAVYTGNSVRGLVRVEVQAG